MNLASNFEDNVADAVLDEVERELVGQSDNLVHQAIDRAHEVLEEYGDRHDYDVGPIIDSLGAVDVQRTDRSITVRLGWEHEAAPYFEYGSSDHTVDGDPILSFIWEDAPQSIHEMFPDTERVDGDPRVFFGEVEVAGLPESRFVRTALNWLRREVTR